MENGRKVLNIGLAIEKVSKVLVKVLGMSLAVLFLGVIIFVITGNNMYLGEYLAFDGHYSFVQFLFIIDYLGLALGLLGLPFYLMSLVYIGIGQVAINTSKE